MKQTRPTYNLTNTCKPIGRNRINDAPKAITTMREKYNLRSGSRMHQHTTPLVPESRLEPSTAILVNQIPEPRLTTKLVDPLGDLVSGSVPKTGEQGEKLGVDGGGSGGSEDDGVERGGVESGLVGHETFCDGVLHGSCRDELAPGVLYRMHDSQQGGIQATRRHLQAFMDKHSRTSIPGQAFMAIDGRTDLKHLNRESWRYQTLLFQACRRRGGTWLRVDRVGREA